MPGPTPERTLLVACAALVREVRSVLDQLGDAADLIDIEYLPASLHNHPEQIPSQVEAVVQRVGADHRVVLGYADCGTGGGLDRLAVRLGATRLPGAHCYEFLAGSDVFAALHDSEPGTFYLTDFLARHFEQLVFVGLGLDRHPELRDLYFGNYRRVVLLSQTADPAVIEFGQAAAAMLSLDFEHHHVGMEPFTRSIRPLLVATEH